MSLEDDLARLEKQVLGATRVRGFLASVAALRKMLANEEPEILRRVLTLTAPKIGRDLAGAIAAGFDLGMLDAVRILDARSPFVEAAAPATLIGAAREAEASIRDDLVRARLLATAGAPVDVALAPVFAAGNRAQRDVATLVNQAGNSGVARVASAAQVPLVWVAETDACVHCLAYSGVVAQPGEAFPGGLTYGAKSYHPEPVEIPPLHPNCRCTLEPLNDQTYADALRREADRSVLRGFSLESESMKARIDAADRLVQGGVDAPKSVIAYARRSIKAGEFPTRNR